MNKLLQSPELPELLSKQLSGLEHELQTEWEAQPAAVLIPLFFDHSSWNLLFTRRTETVESHPGQVSFPGGQIEDDDDDAIVAAIREACEEIGICAEDVNVLGEMNSLMTVTQFIVTPVVGTINWPVELKINQQEVAKAFGVPLTWLAKTENMEVQMREPLIPGRQVPVYFFKPYEGEIIWGVTARITVDLLKILGLIEMT
jgi:8-oxo-dGTP pyrophosphatase MutT (NUDIX family)